MVAMSDNEFVDMLNNVCNGMVGQENRHLFVVDFVKSLDKYVLPSRRSIIKRFLMIVLKQFSQSTSRSVHFETFPLWLLLAKYSETMNVKKILDNVSYLYEDYLPFYRAYINELLSNNQENEAKEMLEKCKEKCRLSDIQLAEEFPTLKTNPLTNLENTLLELPKKNVSKISSISTTILKQDENSLCEQTEALELGSNDVTIKQIASIYKENSGFSGILVASFVGAQLAQLLSDCQNAKLSPQSVVVSAPLEMSLTPEILVEKCVLKVMSSSKNKNDKQSSEFLDVIGQLLFLDSFNVIDDMDGRIPDKAIPRRFPDRELWNNVFRRLLNNDSTDWPQLADELKSNFVKLASTKKTLWTSSAEEFNKHFHSLAM